MQVHAFVAPKIIGGRNAPSPVGELGMVEMSQAMELIDVSYEQVKIFFFCSCDCCVHIIFCCTNFSLNWLWYPSDLVDIMTCNFSDFYRF